MVVIDFIMRFSRKDGISKLEAFLMNRNFDEKVPSKKVLILNRFDLIFSRNS